MRVISAWVDDSWAESLDSAARERGLNRSQLIVLALQELLGITPAQRKRDGIEAAAMQIVRANPSSSLREIVRKLREAGIDRGKSWVHKKRQELSAGYNAHLTKSLPSALRKNVRTDRENCPLISVFPILRSETEVSVSR